MRNGEKYHLEDFLTTEAAGDACFSPDGTQVAYLSTRTGIAQIFLVSMEGGEPEQLTDFSDPISFVQFSPIENVLIFGKAENGNEQIQLYLLDLISRRTSDLTFRPDVRHNFGGWSPDGKHICFASNERNGMDLDVYVMDLSTRKKRRIFEEGSWCVSEGFSPSGTYVVIRQEHSSAHTDLYLCTLKTGVIERITPPGGNAFYGGAQWLPDESAFFLMQDQDREYTGLARYSLAEKKSTYVLTLDWDIDSAIIDRSGTHVAVLVNEAGYEQMQVYDAVTFEPSFYRLPPGSAYRIRFSVDGSHIVFNLADSRRTLDAWVLSLKTGEVRQLTHSRQDVPQEAMVEPELVHFPSFDGRLIPAFIYRKKVHAPDRKAGVVIHIHGGPAEQYKPVYQPLIQFLVYAGFVVVAPNIRGSSGYGKTYMALDDAAKRLDSVKDLVALRKYLAGMPNIDSERVALHGTSYGGFMVLACMTFYPNLWASGVDIIGIVNFVTFLENTAPYRRALREAEYGSLENDRELLEKISPIHSIEKIEAPLLVIHGANDPRVPLSEARQVVLKLKKAGKQVELLVYSDEGHGVVKLQNKLGAYPKIVEFLNRTLL